MLPFTEKRLGREGGTAGGAVLLRRTQCIRATAVANFIVPYTMFKGFFEGFPLFSKHGSRQ